MAKKLFKAKMVWFTLAGLAVGILLVHPVAMLAYTMEHYRSSGPISFTFVLHQLRRAFGPGLVHMGLVFALLGGGAGFVLGAWFLEKERVVEEKMECLRSLAALETLKELMVTLAHYIRNANMVVGGFSDRLLKSISDPEQQEELRLIQHAAQEIDAVIATLQNLTEISTVEYTASSSEVMIDLKKELEARLAKVQLAMDGNQEIPGGK
jgi:signal transduction histidine kinase